MKVIHSSPGLEDLWQMHFSLLSGQEYTVPGMFIANPTRRAAGRDADRTDRGARARPERAASARAQGHAYWIKVSAQQDGTFTVTNTRNGFSKTYAAK